MALLTTWAGIFAVWSEDHLQQSHLGANLQCRFLGTIPGSLSILGCRVPIARILASAAHDLYAHINTGTEQRADLLPRCSGVPFHVLICKPKPSSG